MIWETIWLYYQQIYYGHWFNDLFSSSSELVRFACKNDRWKFRLHTYSSNGRRTRNLFITPNSHELVNFTSSAEKTFSLCQNAKHSNTYHSDVCNALLYPSILRIISKQTVRLVVCLHLCGTQTNHPCFCVCVSILVCVMFVKLRSYAHECVFRFRAHLFASLIPFALLLRQ